jgi:hypothetical protein
METELLKIIYEIAKDCVTFVSSNISYDENKTFESLQKHVIEIERWSRQIQWALGTDDQANQNR